MKSKRIIKSLLIIAIVLFIFLIVLCINVSIKNKDEKENNTISENKYNIIDYNQIDTENLDINNIGSDSPLFALVERDVTDPDKIDYEGQIKRIKLSIANVSDEIQSYIKDKESFAYSIKKYFYENGLLDGDRISLIKSDIQNNEIIMLFKLNDSKDTVLKVIYNFVLNSTYVLKQE